MRTDASQRRWIRLGFAVALGGMLLHLLFEQVASEPFPSLIYPKFKLEFESPAAPGVVRYSGHRLYAFDAAGDSTYVNWLDTFDFLPSPEQRMVLTQFIFRRYEQAAEPTSPWHERRPDFLAYLYERVRAVTGQDAKRLRVHKVEYTVIDGKLRGHKTLQIYEFDFSTLQSGR